MTGVVFRLAFVAILLAAAGAATAEVPEKVVNEQRG
jgi:hypothetical protein